MHLCQHFWLLWDYFVTFLLKTCLWWGNSRFVYFINLAARQMMYDVCIHNKNAQISGNVRFVTLHWEIENVLVQSGVITWILKLSKFTLFHTVYNNDRCSSMSKQKNAVCFEHMQNLYKYRIMYTEEIDNKQHTNLHTCKLKSEKIGLAVYDSYKVTLHNFYFCHQTSHCWNLNLPKFQQWRD